MRLDDLIERVTPLLVDFLPRQRWYGAADRDLESIDVTESLLVRDGWPALAWLLLDTGFADGTRASYQLFVGLRPLDSGDRFLEGKGRAVLGDIDTDQGPALAYDALVDPELAIAVAELVLPGIELRTVRPMTVEQSNTSVVYDERVILKLFRRVADGPNPDVEIAEALDKVGFPAVPATVGTWRRDGRDLAVAREFLTGGSEGWRLALASLRDVYASGLDPSEAGGNLGPESRRLGSITARLHVALAEAFGAAKAVPSEWADQMDAALDRAPLPGDLAHATATAYERLRGLADAGASIRVHGDLHLGQTLRVDEGWYLLDFEGEPAVSLSDRRRPSSPLRDVAGMLRSFHYAAQVARTERDEPDAEELVALAERWEAHVADEFLAGYDEVEAVHSLLPADPQDRQAVLDAFVAAKAVYEAGYEAAHRPEWLWIPLGALRRLVPGEVRPA